MNFIIDNFDKLFNSEESLKRLEEIILDLAIKGKLVPQDPDDEPASVLLEKIKAEKEQLIKEKKIKKDKDLAPITEEEIPFEIPNSWQWVRLGEIANIKSSKRIFEKDYRSNGIPFFRSKEIGELSRGNIISTEIFISEEKYYEIIELHGVPKKGDLLITCVGSIGNTWIADGRQFYYKDGNIAQIDKTLHLDENYIRDFIETNLFFSQVTSSVSGSVYNALTIIKLNGILLPLPPLAEQKRIVEKVDKLKELVNQFREKIQKRDKVRQGLKASIMNEIEKSNSNHDLLENLELIFRNFDSVVKTKEDIKDIRDLVLSLAVKGKLVPQDPNDEPASMLLEKIEAEKEQLIKDKKIKKDKDLTPITEEEIPFEIPESWEWVRLGEIGEFNPRNSVDDELETSFIPMKLIEDGYTNKHTYEISKWKDIKSGFTHFAENDVVIAKITPCFQNRKSAIMKNLLNGFGSGTTELYVIRSYGQLVLSEYILFIAKSPSFIRGGVGTYTGTAGQQRVNKGFVENYLIGLPPLAEQKRIVLQVEKLMKVCDELEKLVEKSQKEESLLMGSIMNGLVG